MPCFQENRFKFKLRLLKLLDSVTWKVANSSLPSGIIIQVLLGDTKGLVPKA